MTTTKLRIATATAALLVAAGCSSDHFNVLNTNAPTVEEVTANPTKLILARVAIGIAQGLTNDVGGEISVWGTFGREGYNLLGNDPRLTNEMVRGPLDPGGVGGGQWFNKFITLRTVNVYLEALERAADMTDEEKAASRGFTNTLKAVLFHRLILRNGTLGIPVDVEAGLDEDPAPFVTQTNAYDRIISLLDGANADLAAGGAAFPFSMPPGYAGFDTPGSFAQFNRGYYAKVQNHRATFLDLGAAAYQLALTALGQSFIDPAGPLNAGAFYAFSSASGDTPNPVAEPTSAVRFYLHPSLLTDAQDRPNGQADARIVAKSVVVDPREQNFLSSNVKPTVYNVPGTLAADLDADVPLLKNEELILLRAEARWFTGDKAGALADIDVIRTRSGGLAPTSLTPGSSDAAFITELLYNRRYSLLWEQGTSWHDVRRFGVESSLPQDRQGDIIFPQMTVPATECDARGLTPPCQPATQ